MTETLDLSTLHLDKGSHNHRPPDDPEDGGVCLMEAVAWFAGEPHSDAPRCVSPYLRGYGIRLNDIGTDEQRQQLLRFIPMVVGTAGDGLDDLRRWLGADHAVRVATPRWLERAGLTEHAEALRALAPIIDQASYNAARTVVYAARDAAYRARSTVYGGKTRWDYFQDAVKAKLAEVGKPVADAVAVADAAADAAADAVAVAVAVAVADAAADAVAVADAAADADLSYGSKRYWEVRDAAYKAARAVYEERYADLIAESWSDAVALFERLITPGQVA